MPDPATVADAIDPNVLLKVLAQVKRGDLSARMPLEWTGVSGKVADGLNDVIRQAVRQPAGGRRAAS